MANSRRRRLTINLMKVGFILISCYVIQFLSILWYSGAKSDGNGKFRSPSSVNIKGTNASKQKRVVDIVANSENITSSMQINNKYQQSENDQDKHNDASTSWWWEFIQPASTKPYLVVCHQINDWIFPLGEHFTVVRIVDGELPPWNATVMLLHEDKFCEEHPYVKEAIRRREKAEYLDTASDSAAMLYHGWNHGVFWPDAASSNKFIRSISNRPALVRERGEVFWRNNDKSCGNADFIVDRQTERLFDDCLTIHYVQGVSSAFLRENEQLSKGDLGVQATFDIYEKRVIHPKANPDVTLPHSKFCSFLIRFDPNNLVDMFKQTGYDVDAIVRHMFFHQLGEYKPCTRVADCGGNPYNSYKCMSQGYKFHITMENSLVNGYISEKVFNGALGSGIPIYFGAEDVGNFINAKSIIHCNVSRSVIEEMRIYYPRAPQPRPFFFNRTSTGFWPTEKELLDWADGYLRPQLEPCVKRVVKLDNNDTAYKEIVSEQFITNHDLLSGQYPFRGIQLALNAMKSRW